MEDMFDALAESEAEARSSGSKDKAAPSPYLTDDDISTDGDTSPHDSDAYPDEWLEWEEFVSQQEGPGVDNNGSDEHIYEALVCITENVSLATPSTKVKREMVTAPSMPCIPLNEVKEHRDKMVRHQLPFPAAVSRPVSRKRNVGEPRSNEENEGRMEWSYRAGNF